MASVAQETLRRMGKASKRPTSQEEKPPLQVVQEAVEDEELVPGGDEFRLVPLEELTALDRRVIRDTFGSTRTR